MQTVLAFGRSEWHNAFNYTLRDCVLLADRLKVTYYPLYSMNKFVTNKLKLPQDGAQVFPYKG